MARGRAYRRHQARLAKRRAYGFLRIWWGLPDPLPAHVGIFASTHCKPCSCWMCGNQRAVEGLTRAELLAELAQKEQTD